jgi:hypothetical protein
MIPARPTAGGARGRSPLLGLGALPIDGAWGVNA